MAPKKDKDSAVADDMKALIVLMASSAEFNPDYNSVAATLGVSHAKNM